MKRGDRDDATDGMVTFSGNVSVVTLCSQDNFYFINEKVLARNLLYKS
jgi:hypothetical protein